MIKAVIFDMDGVIIDSEPIQSKAFETVLKEYGKEPVFNEHGIIQTIGIRAEDNWKRLKELHNIDEKIDVLVKKRRKIYQKLIQSKLKPMRGLISLLQFLKQKKLKMAIASSSNRDNIDIVLSGLGIKHFFSVIVSGESIKKGKPYPDIFLETAKKLQVLPEECMVIEDAEAGVLAASAAGMKIVAIPTRFTNNHDLSKADMIVNSLEEIKNNFLNLHLA